MLSRTFIRPPRSTPKGSLQNCAHGAGRDAISHMAKIGCGRGVGVGAVLLDFRLLRLWQAGPSPCQSRRRVMSLAPKVRAVRSRMLRVAGPAFTGLPVRGDHAADVSLLPGAEIAAALLAVVGAADLLLPRVVLRHLDAFERALACSFSSLPALA